MASDGCLSLVTDCDPESHRLATTALDMIAVSRRHFSIMEIAWAAALGTAQEDVPTVAALSRLVEDLSVVDRIWPFFCNYKPWLGELRKRQFLPMSLNNVPRRPTEALESRLLEVCIRYLLLCEIGDVDLLSEEHVAYEELPESIDLFSDDDKSLDDDMSDTWKAYEDDMIRYDPTDRGFGELFVFASTYWLEYFGAVSDLDVLPRLEDIEKLCQAGSRRLHNWIAQNSRPGCTVRQRFVFDSSLYDPLSITSLYGSEAMLQHMLETADLKSDKYLPNSVLNAADQILQWGDLSRLDFLAKSKHASEIRNFEFFRMAVMQWSARPSDKNREDWDVVVDLLDDTLGMMTKRGWGSVLLRLATRTGCMPFVRRLMDKARYSPGLRDELLYLSDVEEYGLIGLAVRENHSQVVEYLVNQPGIAPHIHQRNSQGENVLHLAARHCNPRVIYALMPPLIDSLQQRDREKQTALMRILASPLASEADIDETIRCMASFERWLRSRW